MRGQQGSIYEMNEMQYVMYGTGCGILYTKRQEHSSTAHADKTNNNPFCCEKYKFLSMFHVNVL